MESHALHGDGLFYESGDRLWVNLYAPSTADWASAGVKISMESSFPEGGDASLSFAAPEPRRFTLALRRPSWAGEGFAVKVNGAPLPAVRAPGGYVEITRTWTTGDRVDITLPKALRLEPLPDNPDRVAIMWGPLVLAGDLGPMPTRRGRGETAASSPAPGRPAVPVLVPPERDVSKWLAPVDGKPGTFTTSGVGRDRDVEFVPFYRLHRRVYGAYWDLLTPIQWEARAAALLTAQAAQRELEAATVAFVQPGQMQTERDFNQQGESSTPAQFDGRYGRRATAWFSFDVPVEPPHPMVLSVTYNRNERSRRAFDILVDGVKIADQTIDGRSPQEKSVFFDVRYAVPDALIAAKQKVTVRFQAAAGSEVAAVYGIRMLRGRGRDYLRTATQIPDESVIVREDVPASRALTVLSSSGHSDRK
jgi:hypothetical protein